jgi:hypothetical protein
MLVEVESIDVLDRMMSRKLMEGDALCVEFCCSDICTFCCTDVGMR